MYDTSRCEFSIESHLKGAINNGATKEEVNNVIQLVFDICDSLNQTQLWKDGKQSVPQIIASP